MTAPPSPATKPASTCVSPDPRVLSDHHRVAKQGDGRAQSRHVAVDRRYHRLLHVEQPVDDAARAGGDRQSVVEAFLRAGTIAHLLDVSARRKCPPGAGDDHGVDIGIRIDHPPDLLQLGMNFDVDRIERFGPIERQRQDASVDIDLQMLECRVAGHQCFLVKNLNPA